MKKRNEKLETRKLCAGACKMREDNPVAYLLYDLQKNRKGDGWWMVVIKGNKDVKKRDKDLENWF